MKSNFLSLVCLLFFIQLRAQYYYKDIVVPRQATAQLGAYKQRKVTSVKLSSFESDGSPTEQFEGSQHVSNNFTIITTNLQTAIAGNSELISTFSSTGMLLNTSDTTDGAKSTTTYSYHGNDSVPETIVNISVSSGGSQEREEHVWTHREGKPLRMLLIKNNTDTTSLQFALDNNGNVTEENGTRNGATVPAYYYYYDDQQRLTDIVTYNIKAKRLLPAYVFEYNDDGLLKSMMVVPEGSSDYQKWYYEYASGLKSRETVFNKKKQMLGKIEYRYE